MNWQHKILPVLFPEYYATSLVSLNMLSSNENKILNGNNKKIDYVLYFNRNNSAVNGVAAEVVAFSYLFDYFLFNCVFKMFQ